MISGQLFSMAGSIILVSQEAFIVILLIMSPDNIWGIILKEYIYNGFFNFSVQLIGYGVSFA